MTNLAVIIEGTVHVNGPVVEVGTNNTKKRTVVVKTDGQYPQIVAVDFLKEKCEQNLKDYQEGDKITITANVGGREYDKDGEMKYFNSINGWKVEGTPTGF